MTLLALITVNVILAALVVYGIVLLLHHGIRSDAKALENRLKAELHRLPSRDRDRLAA
ncbi:MAG TPA: hypothetical protein VGU02_02935 [Gaiellaceae bacterium]|nr:hypothetical protein [Gaiellaceae bacterium]